MKKLLTSLLLVGSMALVGCDTVKPGQVGVLVENYGQNPSTDYSVVTGKVWTATPSTSLYILPANEQRSVIETPIKVKSANNADLEIIPRYSYRINPKKATIVVQQHAKFIGEAGDLKEVENQALDPAITDVVRTIISNTSSEEIIGVGGNKVFNDTARKLIAEEFDRRGLVLLSFSAVVELPKAVKDSINAENTANSKTKTLDAEIEQAKKQLALTRIQAETRQISGSAITQQEIEMALIAKWNGQVPETYAGGNTNVLQMLKGQ